MKDKFVKLIKENYKYLIVLLLALFISNQLTFRYIVVGESMEPTLHNNSFGIALSTKLNLKQIERFNIVVVDTENRLLVKRVIGLPGDRVEYRDNKLYINNKYIEEDFIKNAYTEDLNVTLGENEYYCLGDNRQFSADSRVYGPFNKEDIKAILIHK